MKTICTIGRALFRAMLAGWNLSRNMGAGVGAADRTAGRRQTRSIERLRPPLCLGAPGGHSRPAGRPPRQQPPRARQARRIREQPGTQRGRLNEPRSDRATAGPSGRRQRSPPETDGRDGRPARGLRAAGNRRRRRRQTRRTARSHPLRRPARAGQDHLRHLHPPRSRRRPANRQRRGDDRAEGHHPLLDQRRGAVRSLHRRDPPTAQGRRGVPLSGDGGFSHRLDLGRRASTRGRSTCN